MSVMYEDWLKKSLQSSRLSQAELSRRLTSALGRSLDRNAINKILSGERNMLADEMIEIARICCQPLPLPGSGVEGSGFLEMHEEEIYKHIVYTLVEKDLIDDAENIKSIGRVLTVSLIGFLRSKKVVR